MFNLAHFTTSDMIECGIELRMLCENTNTMEDIAEKIVHYFYNSFFDSRMNERNCALVRLFKTHDLSELPEREKTFALKLLPENYTDDCKCLSLLGTVGIEPEWSDKYQSKSHLAIPLPSKEIVNSFPMIKNMVNQMGLTTQTFIADSSILLDASKTKFNVFHIPNAVNSPYVPAQESFIVPYDIKSVLGFGGVLPSGNVFVIILFLKINIPHATARLFESMALYIKQMIMPLEKNVFLLPANVPKLDSISLPENNQPENTPILLAKIATLEEQLALLERSFLESNTQNEDTKNWLYTTLSSIGDAVIATDQWGNINFMNHIAETVTGWENSEALGKPLVAIFKIINEYTGKEDNDPLKKILNSYQRNKFINHTILISKSGKKIPIEHNASPIINEKHDTIGIVLVFHDVSAVQQAEEEKRHMEAQLLQNQKLEAIGQLAAGVAHEINTPIHFIGDNLHFMETTCSGLFNLIKAYEIAFSYLKDNADLKKHLQNIAKIKEEIDLEFLASEMPKAVKQSNEGVNRVSKIVKALKQFSYKNEMTLQNTDINKLILDSITISKHEWKYIAEVKTDLEPELTQIPCYPDQLGQVFLNLIINAAHAIEDYRKNQSIHHEDDQTKTGVITIKTRDFNSYIEINITDTGCGIKQSIQDKIFEPFFTTKEIGRGTGQGLAIAYNCIVNQHKGKISFTSRENVGTTFVIQIPKNIQD